MAKSSVALPVSWPVVYDSIGILEWACHLPSPEDTRTSRPTSAKTSVALLPHTALTLPVNSVVSAPPR